MDSRLQKYKKTGFNISNQTNEVFEFIDNNLIINVKKYKIYERLFINRICTGYCYYGLNH